MTKASIRPINTRKTEIAMQTDCDVAIVGAGISGLAAAHRILERHPNARLLLLEAQRDLGGVLQTAKHDGYLVEASADSFITNVPWALDLCRRLGIDGQLIPTDARHRRAFVVTRGRLEPIPDGLLIMAPARLRPLLESRILSWPGKLRMGLEWLIPRGSGQDESLASFVRRRFGKEAYERLIQPLLGGMYTGDPERLGIRATMPRFLDMEQAHGSLIRAVRKNAKRTDGAEGSGARYGLFAGLSGGMASLVKALRDRLPSESLRTGCTIVRIDRSPSGDWTLSLQGHESSCIQARSLIIATPSIIAASLLRDLEPQASRLLARIPSTSCAIVSLGFRREQVAHPLDGFGFVVPFVERRPILSSSFSSVKFEGRAPRGHELFRVFVGGSSRPDLVEEDDDSLVRIVCAELESLLGITGEPSFRHVSRWRQVMPQYEVGHLDRISEVETRVARLGAIALAGNYLRGVGVPMCIHTAEQAANAMMERNFISDGVTQNS